MKTPQKPRPKPRPRPSRRSPPSANGPSCARCRALEEELRQLREVIIPTLIGHFADKLSRGNAAWAARIRQLKNEGLTRKEIAAALDISLESLDSILYGKGEKQYRRRRAAKEGRA